MGSILFFFQISEEKLTLMQNKLHKNSIKNPYWSSGYNFIFGEKGIYGKSVGLQKTKIFLNDPLGRKKMKKIYN